MEKLGFVEMRGCSDHDIYLHKCVIAVRMNLTLLNFLYYQDKRGNPWVVRLLLTDTNVPQHLHRTRAIMYSLPISSRGIPVTVSNKYQWHISPVYIIRRGHCGGQYPSTLETESLRSSRATDFFSLCISRLCNDNSTYCRFCTDYRAWDGSGFSFNIESGLVWHWDKFGGIVYCWISCAVCSVEPHMVESIKMDILSVILPPSVFELFKVGLWCHPAFYGIIDLLSVMPYYIELLLQQDTVSSFALSGSSLNNVPQSILFRFSILRMFRLLRVFRPFRYTHTILLWVSQMSLCRSRSKLTSIELSRLCTSPYGDLNMLSSPSRFSWLWYSPFLVLFCMCISFDASSLTLDQIRYFAERGAWDETLQAFINSDGDPSQFSVCLNDLPIDFLPDRNSLSQLRPGK